MPAQLRAKSETVIGGGGTYAVIGARMWLPAEQLGIVVDRGNDWPAEVSPWPDHVPKPAVHFAAT